MDAATPEQENEPESKFVFSTDDDRRKWIEENLYILDKDKHVIPFKFNPIQADYWESRTLRDTILKFRQLGFTTLTLADFFEDTIHVPNTTTIIVAHDGESTEKIFSKVQLFYDKLPDDEKIRLNGKDKFGRPRKPKYGNRREFYFKEINSRIYVGTAGNLKLGRSQTINNLLCSELAFWPDPETLLTGLLQSVPYNGRVVVECTANGFNYFYNLYEEGKTGQGRWKSHFFPWFRHKEYLIPLEHGERIEYTQKERELVQRFNLTPEQIKWRRWKVSEMPNKAGYTKEELFLQEYPEDDLTCFLSSGRPVFDRNIILARKNIITQSGVKPFEYTIDHAGKQLGSIHQQTHGELLIWKMPQLGRFYVIGADVAEGIAGAANSAASVLDYYTGEQVAELWGKWDPDIFGKKLSRLGWFYNTAEVGPERNNHGHSVLNTMLNYEHYPRLYHHQDYDAENGKLKSEPGYPTNSETKPIMLADMVAAIREGWWIINSIGLLDECFTYVLDEKGRAVPEPGNFSDRVIAAAIGLQIRKTARPGDGPRMVNVRR